MASRRLYPPAALVAATVLAVACGGASDTDFETGDGSPSGGSGGSSGSGGGGGSSRGGTSGTSSEGGSDRGGTTATGGTSGSATGGESGSATGGTSTGGESGSATGGTSTGGESGSATGGTSTGGVAGTDPNGGRGGALGGAGPAGAGGAGMAGGGAGSRGGAGAGGRGGGGAGGAGNCANVVANAQVALRSAQVCSPAVSPRCTGSVEDLCGCTVPVNDPDSAATKSYLAQREAAIRCGVACVAIACPEPTNVTCEITGGTTAIVVAPTYCTYLPR